MDTLFNFATLAQISIAEPLAVSLWGIVLIIVGARLRVRRSYAAQDVKASGNWRGTFAAPVDHSAL